MTMDNNPAAQHWIEEGDHGQYQLLDKASLALVGSLTPQGEALLYDHSATGLQALLKHLYQQGIFIRCHCTTQLPLSHICAQQGGNYYWRKNKGAENTHTDTCPLHANIAHRSTRKTFTRPLPLDGNETLNLFAIAPPAAKPVAGARKPKQISTRTAGKHSPLGRLLLTMLEQSGSLTRNRHFPAPAFRPLIDAAGDISLVEGVKVGEMLVANHSYLQSKFVKITKGLESWPADQRKVALLLAVATDIDHSSQSLVINVPKGEPTTITLTGKLHPVFEGSDKADAPYLCLIAYRQDDNGSIEPYECAYTPIVSDINYFPVESNNERSIYRLLFWVMSDIDPHKNRAFTLEKPIRPPAGCDTNTPMATFMLYGDPSEMGVAVIVSNQPAEEGSDPKAALERQCIAELVKVFDMTGFDKEAVTTRRKAAYHVIHTLIRAKP